MDSVIVSLRNATCGSDKSAQSASERKTTPGIPTGETLVTVEGAQYESLFRKVAVNVLRHPGNPRNELQDVLRRWFGPDAGLPGTNFQVAFRPTRAGWTLEPLKPARADAPAI